MDEDAEVPSIPKQFAVKLLPGKETYLQVVPSQKEPFGYLQFAGDTIISPFAKFEVENSKLGKGLVHIRCVYNNKYWVLHSKTSHFIVAAAKEPEEDQSKHTCTLFKPAFFDEDEPFYRLRHVHLNRNIHLHEQELDGLKSCMFANSSNDEYNYSDNIIFFDWESLCILPRYVAFKGDNGCYLRPAHYSRKKSKAPFLSFSSNDIADPGVRNEIITSPTGVISIKNVPYGKYWVHEPNWIMVKGDEDSADEPNALFEPIKVDNNVVVLRSLANFQICKRLSIDGKTNCLNASESTIVDEAKMEVVELVLSRKIYNVNFRVSDSRIYNEKPIVLATSHGVNMKDSNDKLSVKITYEDTVTTTWSNTVSAKFGVQITIETGIPKIAENEIEISVEAEEENTWGRTFQKKALMEVVHDVVVPKRSKLKASIFATQGTCDIPFSYSQRDKLLNGKTVVRRLHDGLFTGINCYNFKFVAEQEPL